MAPKNKTRIVVIRHGSTEYNGTSGNSSECVRGWKDIPLSAEGKREVKALAKELRNVKMDALYSSNLDRAEATALAINKETGTPILGSIQGLRPWDLGNLAGKKASDCRGIILDYLENKPASKVPGGEAFVTFRDRLLDCLDEL